MFKSKNGDIVIGEVNIDEEKEKEENEDQENQDEENIDKEIDYNLVNVEKYNLEEKINIIEKILLGIENIENFEIYDDEIIKVEYDIQYIYKIWKIGKNISKYINEGKKFLFFKEFLKTSFNSNKNFKIIIIKKIERILKIFNYIKKYAILYNKKNVIHDANQNLEIMEKNFKLFNEIMYFKGIISKKGVDIEKIFEKNKVTINYENGDIYKGEIKNGEKEGKGIMVYKNGYIYDGYWKNDKKEGKGIMIYKNGEILDTFWKEDEPENYIIKYNDIEIYKKNNIEAEIENNFENNDKIELNDNESTEFIKNIDLKKQYCQVEKHKNLIIGFCIDKNCKNENKLLCQKCFFKEHKQHDIIEIDEYNENLKEYFLKEKKIISELKNINKKENKSDKNHLKIEELKNNINSLIDQNFESFISSTFENLINKNENNLNKKILNLKNNFPIDNIEKEIEMSHIISSLKENKNNNIENFNDILKIKIKNIQNEIEKIILKILYDKNYLYEIENFWTKESFISNNNEFNYEIKENNYLAQKINENKQIIKSKLILKEKNIYKIIFNIIVKNELDDFEVGFGTIELCKTKTSLKEKGGICLSKKGLFIDGIKVNKEINIDDNDEICFILNLNENEKFFVLFVNGKLSEKFNFRLTNMYALASLEGNENSVKIRTFVKF